MSAAPRPGRSSRLDRLLRPAILFVVVVGIAQLYYWFVPGLSSDLALLATFAVPLATLGAFLLWTRWDGRPLAAYGWTWPPRPVHALAVAAVLVLVYVIAILEPGLGFGFMAGTPFTATNLAFWLAYAPLTALAGEAVFRGGLLDRWLVPGRFAGALGVSSALFALAGTNLAVLSGFAPVDLVRYLLTNSVGLFLLGVVLGFYYFRSNRNLLGPVALRTGTLWFAGISPVLARSPNWQTTFLLDLFAVGLVLFLIGALLRQSRLTAHLYLGESFGPRRNRFVIAGRSGGWRTTVVLSVLVVLAVSGGFVALETTLGTSHPILAIESGSMSPTFNRGDLVVIQHAGPDGISVGTVIAYLSTCMPSPVVHRVVAVKDVNGQPVYTTRGDANPGDDPCPASYGAVLGRVVAVVPVLGYFVLSPMLAVGVVALAVIATYLVRPAAPSRYPHRKVNHL